MDATDDEWIDGRVRGGSRGWTSRMNPAFHVSRGSGLPLLYAAHPGPVLDISTLPDLFAGGEELGTTDACFVLGPGFCSTANVKRMNRRNLGFFLAVGMRLKEARVAIDFSRNSTWAVTHPHQ